MSRPSWNFDGRDMIEDSSLVRRGWERSAVGYSASGYGNGTVAVLTYCLPGFRFFARTIENDFRFGFDLLPGGSVAVATKR